MSPNLHLDLRVDLLGRRGWPLAGVLLVLAGGALLAWQGRATLDEAARLQRQRDGLASLERARQRPATPAMSPEDRRRHEQMRAVAQHLAAPWPALLALFEERAGPQLTLTRLHPDATTGRVELTAQAATAAAAGRFLLALQADARLRDVQLVRHEVLADQPGSPVALTVVAAWTRADDAAAAAAPAGAGSAP